MARLPNRESLGALPATPRRQITRISPGSGGGIEIARGLSNLGKGVASGGLVLDEHSRRQDEFEAERKYQEFDWEQRRQLDERMRNVQPGQARTFANQWQQEYVERAKEFKKGLPDHVKETYDSKLFRAERDLYGSATTFARTEQKRFSVASIDQARENIYRPKARTTATEELDTVTADYERLVRANPDLTPIEQDELIRKGRREIGLSHLDGLPPERARAVINSRTAQSGDTLTRIAQVESGGDPNAKAKTSSALGPFQFTRNTWLDTIRRHRPDLKEGKTDAELLDLRKDPALSREMAGYLLSDNSSALEQAGVPVNPGTQYLAHFLGAVDAVKALQANPNTPISQIVASDRIAANKSILEGKTVGEVTAWAERKMGGVPSAFSALTDEDWIRAEQKTDTRARAEVLDQERAIRVQQQQAKLVSDAEEIEIAKVLADPAQRESVTATSIANNSKLTREAIQRNIALIERGDRTDSTYGSKFYEIFQRVHLPQGDPNRIAGIEQIVPFVREGGGLTLSGYNQIVTQLKGKNTPEGESESKMLSQFLQVANQELSGTNPLLGIKDPKGEELVLRFSAQVLPLYYKLRGQGKTPAQLLDPDSPEYLGKTIKSLKRPYNEQVRDMLGSLGAGEVDTSTPQGVISAVQSGKITREAGEKIALEKGWIRPSAPPVAPPISR